MAEIFTKKKCHEATINITCIIKRKAYSLFLTKKKR